jgi:hypothetical protein
VKFFIAAANVSGVRFFPTFWRTFTKASAEK